MRRMRHVARIFLFLADALTLMPDCRDRARSRLERCDTQCLGFRGHPRRRAPLARLIGAMGANRRRHDRFALIDGGFGLSIRFRDLLQRLAVSSA
jgi:hypothetical protein